MFQEFSESNFNCNDFLIDGRLESPPPAVIMAKLLRLAGAQAEPALQYLQATLEPRCAPLIFWRDLLSDDSPKVLGDADFERRVVGHARRLGYL